ncbi:unnamed protein product [Cladocopium goreaui]|uniref:Calcium/calmodulin-dependent protein kinase type 1 n=1 Tax=Cladocopium goreaui TaxID=2562237 RepID=A0A9P1C9Y2_9DINO|nr:unnamed protein product [Cladocopium goreaui]
MGYRVNGLPPFQVSFSITFPEGYVGKEKMDTKFKVEADDSQVQVGVLNQLARTAKYETNKSSAPTLDADSLELHTKLEALKVIASTASPVLNKCNGRGSIDDDETTEGSERGDLVPRLLRVCSFASVLPIGSWKKRANQGKRKQYVYRHINGGFHKWGIPKMVGLQWTIPFLHG